MMASEQPAKRQKATIACVGSLPGVGAEVQHRYLSWLGSHGAAHPSLRFGHSSLGGAGLFALRDIPAGEDLLSTPSTLAITELVAAEWWSSLGCPKPVPTEEAEAAEARVESHAASAVDSAAVLYLFLIVGRFAEPQAESRRPHPSFWHPYLAALPNSYTDPSWWTELLPEPGVAATARLFNGSTLSSQLARKERGLRQRLASLIAALSDASLQEGPAASASTEAKCTLTWERMIWAQSTVLSRAFPAAVGGGNKPVAIVDPRSNAYQQALLPLHDILNHAAGVPTVWRTAGGRIAFSVGVNVAKGQEALINYGKCSVHWPSSLTTMPSMFLC